MGFVNTSYILAPGYVKTTSRLQMWWLTNLRGYSIEKIMRFPRHFRMGHLVYGSSWILRPPHGKSI